MVIQKICYSLIVNQSTLCGTFKIRMRKCQLGILTTGGLILFLRINCDFHFVGPLDVIGICFTGHTELSVFRRGLLIADRCIREVLAPITGREDMSC